MTENNHRCIADIARTFLFSRLRILCSIIVIICRTGELSVASEEAGFSDFPFAAEGILHRQQLFLDREWWWWLKRYFLLSIYISLAITITKVKPSVTSFFYNFRLLFTQLSLKERNVFECYSQSINLCCLSEEFSIPINYVHI